MCVCVCESSHVCLTGLIIACLLIVHTVYDIIILTLTSPLAGHHHGPIASQQLSPSPSVQLDPASQEPRSHNPHRRCTDALGQRYEDRGKVQRKRLRVERKDRGKQKRKEGLPLHKLLIKVDVILRALNTISCAVYQAILYSSPSCLATD